MSGYSKSRCLGGQGAGGRATRPPKQDRAAAVAAQPQNAKLGLSAPSALADTSVHLPITRPAPSAYMVIFILFLYTTILLPEGQTPPEKTLSPRVLSPHLRTILQSDMKHVVAG